MALFTDGTPNSVEALRRYETAILDVATTEGIDLEVKLSLAADEVGDEVLGYLLAQGPRDPQAAILGGIFGFYLLRRTVGLTTVVVTPQMRRWHAFHTLAAVYRDAYNNQLNDRYQGKWQQYIAAAREARRQALDYGIALVQNPVAKAAAPLLSATPGILPGAVYYVSIAWVNGQGQEGCPSDPTTFQTGAGTQLTVQAPTATAGPMAWNVYAGTAADGLSLQNDTPLAAGTFWVMPASGLTAGRQPGDGQQADMFVTHDRVLPRG